MRPSARPRPDTLDCIFKLLPILGQYALGVQDTETALDARLGGKPVSYGQVVQLQHRSANKFLAAKAAQGGDGALVRALLNLACCTHAGRRCAWKRARPNVAGSRSSQPYHACVRARKYAIMVNMAQLRNI